MPYPKAINRGAFDLSHPDVAYLLDYIAELENELQRARDYLEACRTAAGANEGELLIHTIRRRIPGTTDEEHIALRTK